MNKSIKKIVALLLSVLIIMSTFAVVFSSFAVDDTTIGETTAAEEEIVEHDQTTFFSLIIQFFKEIGNFFKYICYDVFLGRPAPTAPSLEPKN